ncbi:DUF177 domain-containing protein [Altererythrobacter aerius]|uniref:DUF177 domain-containing protein n=1 Tax=Tsuneonella aeria TaxID=1837929 RepID=A0A6I4TEG1_9SPHN|nr:DUF177 domain-containing protein [Tsuneonella aeria]MXO75047.1 DUF177 domain-containing protein [Tsuneonella aeria]
MTAERAEDPAPEFVRMIRARPVPPEHAEVSANADERAALARRFGVRAVDAMRAEVDMAPDGDAILATGVLHAELTQACAVSGEDFAVRLEEPLALRFVTKAREVDPEEEAELPADEPDEIEYAGDMFDLGEAVAQTLALAIDPYAEGPGADAARREAGIVDEDSPKGPLADALAALRK